ncbi:MAG: alpha/beta fold hydrolase [Ktedonobacterales bacterium]
MHADDGATDSQRDPSLPPALVFVHGSGDSAGCWAPIIQRLPQCACLALDLPGHGALVDRPGPSAMSVADYADYVRHELTRRNLADVCLVGHSLGSAIALTLALEWPALVGRLVLVGAGARLRVLPNLLAEARTHPEATIRALVTLGHAPGHEQMAERGLAQPRPTAPGMLYRDLAACDAFDLLDDLGRIAQAALIVVGAEDRLTPPKYARFLCQRLTNATLVTIPDAGHYVMEEAPDALADAIRAWLS